MFNVLFAFVTDEDFERIEGHHRCLTNGAIAMEVIRLFWGLIFVPQTQNGNFLFVFAPDGLVVVAGVSIELLSCCSFWLGGTRRGVVSRFAVMWSASIKR